MSGLSTALSEITLVLFTTLAPSGTVAYVLMNLPIVFGRARGADHDRLDKLSCLPLIVAMVGLVASATHLGNPSNALYVFTAVGRSPLSTEVFCAVVFLAMAGVYWLYSFSLHPRRGLQRTAVVVIDLAALAFLVAVAFAYDVDTITTWSMPLVPACLLANSLMGGPIIACLGFAAASYAPAFPAWGRRLVGLSAAALAVNVALYVAMAGELLGAGNELASVAQLVPDFPLCLAAFAALGAAALCVAWRSLRFEGRRRVMVLSGASALVLAGIFVMRFVFYMSHLTVGLGV